MAKQKVDEKPDVRSLLGLTHEALSEAGRGAGGVGMAWTDADIENFRAWLIERGEKNVREALLRDEYGEMQKELAVQFLDGLDAERAAEQRETNRIVRAANKWAKWAIVISLIALAVALFT